MRSRGLVPFLDLAYQGFAEGLDADAYAARLFADAMSPVFLSSSFSKSFSLYGERVGALSVVTGSPEEATRVLSQLKRIVRTNYSNPPTHGSQIVATVLGNPQLRSLWDRELGAMRERIKAMRKRAGRQHPGARAGRRLQLRAEAARHVLLLRADARSRCGGCARNTRSTPSTPAASASPRSHSKNVDYVADAIARVIG